MGTNSEERGEIILPSRAVLDVRNALVQNENERRAKALELAQQIYTYLRSEAGGKDRRTISSLLRHKPVDNHYNLFDFVGKLIEQRIGAVREPSPWSWQQADDDSDLDRFELNCMVERLLVKRATERGAHDKLQSPKKKDLPPLAASKTWAWSNSECSVRINPKTRVLSWYVDYSKNAVDDAWSSRLGRALRQALDKVEWTRGTGGVFNYSDEHMRDAAMDHGSGGTRISHRFGPRGDAEFKAQTGYLPPRPRRRGF